MSKKVGFQNCLRLAKINSENRFVGDQLDHAVYTENDSCFNLFDYYQDRLGYKEDLRDGY